VNHYLECWTGVAARIFSQALAGEPELSEALPRPLANGAFGFVATLSGDEAGRFSVVLDSTVLESPLVGEGMDQKSGWGELLREVADAAAGGLLAGTGRECRVETFEEIAGVSQVTRAFQLKSAGGAWIVLVHDELHAKRPEAPAQAEASRVLVDTSESSAATGPGIELLLDIELEASLRFGCREMALSEILDLGPGDVVELDRHASDPVDLIVGDKIVARGEAVLVNGNFGLRVTDVAAPRKRLESVRCLF
jgi:flagellar motor switch protein FliN/FliY